MKVNIGVLVGLFLAAIVIGIGLEVGTGWGGSITKNNNSSGGGSGGNQNGDTTQRQ